MSDFVVTGVKGNKSVKWAERMGNLGYSEMLLQSGSINFAEPNSKVHIEHRTGSWFVFSSRKSRLFKVHRLYGLCRSAAPGHIIFGKTQPGWGKELFKMQRRRKRAGGKRLGLQRDRERLAIQPGMCGEAVRQMRLHIESSIMGGE
ncbi:hypothetical protein Ddc_13594 [Ditylenchus destructor]|nr:hypothetical protein Ddc_13594 [Ditylenchus destructor]